MKKSEKEPKLFSRPRLKKEKGSNAMMNDE